MNDLLNAPTEIDPRVELNSCAHYLNPIRLPAEIRRLQRELKAAEKPSPTKS